MNCAKGDLAFVKTTHRRTDMHGRIVKCLEYDVDATEGDIWHCELAGQPMPDDCGIPTRYGWIQDRHLRPIKGLGVAETTPTDEPVPA